MTTTIRALTTPAEISIDYALLCFASMLRELSRDDRASGSSAADVHEACEFHCLAVRHSGPSVCDDKTAAPSPSVAELAFARVLAALPKYLDKSRVTMATGLAASQLRVSLDGRLVSHLAHSVYGWTPWESGMGHNDPRASAAVYRAIRKATKDGGK